MHPSVLPASVSLYDARPFFEKALQYGVQHGIIDRPKLDAICADAPKGMVQIARYFGNEFLRPDLEKARKRIVNLVSLYLESSCGGDLRLAAESLRDHSFLSRSKGGSDLLKALLALPENTVFDTHPGGLDASGPPKGLAEWSLKSFADYQAELARRMPLQQEKGAALWLAGQLGLGAEALEESHTHAEAVIRTALLALAIRRTAWPDWVAFEKTVAALRKKYRPDSAETLAIVIPANLPPEFAAVVQALQSRQLGSLALDVYEEESALFFHDHSGEIIDDELFQRLTTFPNVLITGHQGFFTQEALHEIAAITVHNLQCFANGIPCANILPAAAGPT